MMHYPELRPKLVDLLVKHWPTIKVEPGIDALRTMAMDETRPLGQDVLWELLARLN